MTFNQFWYGMTVNGRIAMIKTTGIARSSLWSIADGRRTVGLQVANKLLKQKGVTREMLRLINPELL